MKDAFEFGKRKKALQRRGHVGQCDMAVAIRDP
jgi:hypothetical protein